MLFNHVLFGPNIKIWKTENLIELFDEKNFGLKTIIKIAIGLNSHIDIITELIIYYKLNYDDNDNSTILQYDYHTWIYDIIEIFKELEINCNDLSKIILNKFSII
jgi:hypothetical protein